MGIMLYYSCSGADEKNKIEKMESTFLKTFLREENRPIMAVFLAIFFLQLLFSAYLVLDIKKGKRVEEKAQFSTISIKQDYGKREEEKRLNEVGQQSFAGPQIQITATDPKVKVIIDKVFKHIFLPSGNVQIETVAKPDELRKINPIFYQWAKTGDQLLVYSDRAILYDPVADRVLDVVHFSK